MSCYDTKQSDGEVPVMLELGRMQRTLSLLSLPGPLWPWVVAPDRALSIGQIELTWGMRSLLKMPRVTMTTEFLISLCVCVCVCIYICICVCVYIYVGPIIDIYFSYTSSNSSSKWWWWWLERVLEKLKIGGRIKTVQTTAFLRSAWIPRRVLETWGNLPSLRLQRKPTN